MAILTPIQADLEGLCYAIAKRFGSFRKRRRSYRVRDDFEARRRDLLKRAKEGDEEAIQILKERYRIKSFVHRGKRII